MPQSPQGWGDKHTTPHQPLRMHLDWIFSILRWSIGTNLSKQSKNRTSIFLVFFGDTLESFVSRKTSTCTHRHRVRTPAATVNRHALGLKSHARVLSPELPPPGGCSQVQCHHLPPDPILCSTPLSGLPPESDIMPLTHMGKVMLCWLSHVPSLKSCTASPPHPPWVLVSKY